MILTTTVAFAQQAPSKEQRRQWEKEMLEHKIDFIANELKITQEQKDKFVQTYTTMLTETNKYDREVRVFEHSISKKENVTDLEYEKAAETLWEAGGKKNDIEMRYFTQFKTFLTKEQLFKFRSAEGKWMKHLMKQHHQGGKHKKK